MIGRSKPQLQFNQFARNNGSSPLRKGEMTVQHKENQFPLNNMINSNYAKPLISPKKQQQSDRITFDQPVNRKSQNLRTQRSPQANMNASRGRSPLVCCNHPNKKAQFRTYIDDSTEYFCGRCAAQLVTQGCKVEQLENSVGHGMKVSKKNQLPHLPQYENQPIYHEIMDIIKLCNTVVGEHSSNIQRFSSLDEEYGQQVDLTTTFYDRLIDIIEEMKTDHISDLIQERDKYTQIADIENDNLRQNIIEVNGIKSDIQHHMEEVLEGIKASGDSAECRESLEHYRQKLTLFHHQTEDQLQSLSQVTRYSQNKIDSMVVSFQNFLKEMWDQQTQGQTVSHPQKTMNLKQMNNAMTVKNIHQILPKGVNYQQRQSKSAFRNLQAEQEEEEELEHRKSPNFKKI